MRALVRVVRSFGYAGEGLAHLVGTQANFRAHLLALAVVTGLVAWLGVGGAELAALVLAIGLVLVAEAVNTSIEAAVNLAAPGRHPLAKIAKDVGAAAVVLAALTAVVVGLVVLLPRLVARLHG